MQTFAALSGNTIFEIIPPSDTPIGLRFSADFVAALVDITGYNPAPDVGWIGTLDGTRWTFQPPPAAASPIPLMAAAALSVGVTVHSASNPGLSGTYPVDVAAQGKMTATSAFVAINGRFPGGNTILSWADINGGIHQFTTTDSFLEFATAIADYVAMVDMVIIGQQRIIPRPFLRIS